MQSRVFQLIGGDTISAEEQWRLLNFLYDNKAIGMATFAILIASGLLLQNGWPANAAIWSGSAVLLLAIRFCVSRAYRRRAATSTPARWAHIFGGLAMITGFQWGLGSLVFVSSIDGAIFPAVFGVQAVLTCNAAARGYACPGAAILQVTITLLIASGCFLAGGQYFNVCLLGGLLFYEVAFVQRLAAMNLKQIMSDEQRKTLLESLGRANEELAAANTLLQKTTMTDALTGIANRRGFDLEMLRSWTKGQREGTPVSLLLIDADHFKRFNDNYGHPAGDECLVRLGVAIKATIRAQDHVSRYGGEEFVVILPDTGRPVALMVATRIAEAVRLIEVPLQDRNKGRITVSIGLASVTPDWRASTATLLSRADQALYRAKQDGRDCIRESGLELVGLPVAV